jgi:hypothetical protein
MEKQSFDLLGVRQDESQHKVTLTRGYYLGVYTVTQEQWQAVMGNNPSYFTGEKNLPVERVSWHDCQVFIKKLRQKDKKPYRLPTEASGNMRAVPGRRRPFIAAKRSQPTMRTTTATSPMATGRRAWPEAERPL